MNSDLALITIWKRYEKWTVRSYQTLEQRKAGRRQLLKLFALYELMVQREETATRRMWVRPIFRERRRIMQGASDNLVREMQLEDREIFFNFCRMSCEIFDKLLAIVGPHIEKHQAIRDPIPARTRLLAALRYLASGDSMASISFAFRIGLNTVSKIIAETCAALWNSLHKSVFPSINENNWLKIADDFDTKWNFPHCLGAIDGKHVVIQAPPHSGSTYYNYKGSHSRNLLAVVDANYCFTLVDIGAEGRQSDGGVFRNSNFGQLFAKRAMCLPRPQPVELHGPPLPYVLLADEAFALSEYMMRPYPRSGRLNMRKKIFNYRLSRGRRMVESTFGILAERWRIYRRPIIALDSTVVSIVQATTCLHNFIIKNENKMSNSDRRYFRILTEEQSVDSSAFQDMSNAGRANAHTRYATVIRDNFAEYFENAGAVPWQWQKALGNEF